MNATDRNSWSVRRQAAVLVGFLLAAGALAAQGQGTKATVADVIPLGNRTVPPQKILSVVKTRPGAEYADATVNEDVERLYKTGLFRNIRARTAQTTSGTVNVFFEVVEFPSVIQEVVYRGAKHFSPDELDTATGLRRGQPLNPITARMARESILRKYYEKGRMHASVELAEGDKPGDTRVVFNITEGPVVRVSSIQFTGNAFVSGARLNTQVNTSRSFLGLGGRFNPDMADGDVKKLEEYYRSYGYRDVKVARDLQWDPDFRTVTLTFHIQEGVRYEVVGTQIDNARALNPDYLATLITTKTGTPYNQNQVDLDKANIQNAYGYRGMNTLVRERTYSPSEGQLVVNYQVEERPVARVGNVQVIGNDVTKQRVVLRELPFELQPGQILRYPDLRLAERNLARRGIFKVDPEAGIRPLVYEADPNSDSEHRDLIVQVQETETGSLLFGLGVNSDAGLVGSIVLNEKNFDITRFPTSFDDFLNGRAFRGAGQEFRVEAVPGTELQRYTVTWRDPAIFDSRYSLGVSGFYFDRDYLEYRESRVGGRVTVGRRLNDNWSASLTGRVENVQVGQVHPLAPADFQEVRGGNFLAGLRAGVSYDTRDSYLRPTEGFYSEASYEQVFGDYTFPLLNFEASKYWTVRERPDNSGRWVVAARTQVGIAGSNTPVFERFYAGGFRSLRGFEFRGVGPDVDGFKVGGEFMLLNSVELQVPILANDHLYAVFFVDSGTVEREVELTNYRVTAGAGLRIVVPMLGPVPIALDFGFPIVKGDRDRDQIFSFWVGFFH